MTLKSRKTSGHTGSAPRGSGTDREVARVVSEVPVPWCGLAKGSARRTARKILCSLLSAPGTKHPGAAWARRASDTASEPGKGMSGLTGRRCHPDPGDQGDRSCEFWVEAGPLVGCEQLAQSSLRSLAPILPSNSPCPAPSTAHRALNHQSHLITPLPLSSGSSPSPIV